MGQTGRRELGSRGVRLALALAIATAAAGAAPPAAAEWWVQTGGHLDYWAEQDGDRQKGLQLLVPLGLGYDGASWGLAARGAFGIAERDPGVGATSSVTSFTDTTLTGYFRFTSDRWELRGALDLDLPTGKSRLEADELLTVMDEDLVALERFGEGFDVNPTLSVYRNFGTLGLGLGVGYLFRGEYQPTRGGPDDDLDPGDELTAALLGDFYLGDVTRLIVVAAYTRFTGDERGGVETLREGDEIDVRATLEWRPEPWWAVITLRDAVRFKSERLDATGRFGTEPRNSHGNEIEAGLTVGYILEPAWELRGTVRVRHVSANDYAVSDVLHDGGRTKVAFGPSVTWQPHRRFTIDAGAQYFVMDAKKSLLFPQDTTIHGVHADLRVTYRF